MMAKVTRLLNPWGVPTSGVKKYVYKRKINTDLTALRGDFSIGVRKKPGSHYPWKSNGFVIQARQKVGKAQYLPHNFSLEFLQAGRIWGGFRDWHKKIWDYFAQDVWWPEEPTNGHNKFMEYAVYQLKNQFAVLHYPYPGDPRIPEIPQVEMLLTGNGMIYIRMASYYDWEAFHFMITFEPGIRTGVAKEVHVRKGKTVSMFLFEYFLIGVPQGDYFVKIEAFSPTGGVAGCYKVGVNPHINDFYPHPWDTFISL